MIPYSYLYSLSLIVLGGLSLVPLWVGLPLIVSIVGTLGWLTVHREDIDGEKKAVKRRAA